MILHPWSKVLKSLRKKLSTLTEVSVLSVVQIIVSTTERLHTSGPSNHSVNERSNTGVLKKKKINGIDSSEDS